MTYRPPNLPLVNSQSGFNLLEVCLAMILLGLVIGTGMSVYSQHRTQMAEQTTHDNMRAIIKALNNYAQTFDRLPCPANPAASDGSFGFESGVDAATIADGRPPGNCSTGNTAGGVRNGLIPYQTLNIPYEMTMDGWGQYFTYGVSPVFTLPNDIYRDEWRYNASGNIIAGSDNTEDGDVQYVHQKCREAGWVNAQEDPVNATKARFCCAFDTGEEAATSDIIITNRDNNTEVSPVRASNGNAVYSGRMNELYRSAHTPPAGQVLVSTPTAATEVEAAAFALISHGPDGNCAFLGNNTNSRANCTASLATDDERDNGGGRTYYTGIRTRDFDDIVIWMTQFGIMAAGGSNSCNLP